MLAHHIGLDAGGADAEATGEMDAEAQAVEIGAGTEHAVMAGEKTRNIDQRLRRVGQDKDRRRRRDLDQPWHDILEHLYIGVEKTKPSGRILAVRGAAAFSLTPAARTTRPAPARSS